jgi:hypothetical protein
MDYVGIILHFYTPPESNACLTHPLRHLAAETVWPDNAHMVRKSRRLPLLEHRLELLFEGMFSGGLGLETILKELARAFEDAAWGGHAPNTISVMLNPDDLSLFHDHFPFLEAQLTAYVMEVARDLGLVLPADPHLNLLASDAQKSGSVGVDVGDVPHGGISTEKMSAVPGVGSSPPADAQLLRDGRLLMRLERPVINIGRRADNHLVLDESRISRQHCQLRVRGGHYVIYDLNSTHGVFVGGERISEQILQNGDVISLGSVTLIYLEDVGTDNQRPMGGDTAINRPVGLQFPPEIE